jgi:hypothetical protein
MLVNTRFEYSLTSFDAGMYEIRIFSLSHFFVGYHTYCGGLSSQNAQVFQILFSGNSFAKERRLVKITLNISLNTMGCCSILHFYSPIAFVVRIHTKHTLLPLLCLLLLEFVSSVDSCIIFSLLLVRVSGSNPHKSLSHLLNLQMWNVI